jgi:hypothetical protein
VVFQTAFQGGGHDAFVTALQADGREMMSSADLGGRDDDQGYGIALDAWPNSHALVTGITQSIDFPTTPKA